MNKLVCIVGMCGAGKSEVANFFMSRNFGYVRFGQITLDTVKAKGLEVNEVNEKAIREGLRQEHGPAAFAILNMPKFDELLKIGNVVGDGLYSWSEYKVLKDKYKEQLIILCVYASPKTRYERLANRAERHGQDDDSRFRSIPPAKAAARDYAEIENIEKAGPIAMADYTIINEGNLDELNAKLQAVLKSINE